jgi:hypothetical protein
MICIKLKANENPNTVRKEKRWGQERFQIRVDPLTVLGKEDWDTRFTAAVEEVKH